MCRLFAVRSEEPVAVTRGFSALKRLAVEHKDGWGIARFDSELPHVHRCVAPAFECPRFQQFAGELRTRSLVAHIRKASVGAVTRQNAHPFMARGLAFAHNGTVRRFGFHKRRIDKLIHPEILATLQGDTDSERCFGLIQTYLRDVVELTPERVAHACAQTMVTLGRLCDRPKDKEHTSLNFVITDGRWMVATRRGRTMVHMRHGRAHVVASEPLWEGVDWVAMPEDGLVIVNEDLSLREATITDFVSTRDGGAFMGDPLDSK